MGLTSHYLWPIIISMNDGNRDAAETNRENDMDSDKTNNEFDTVCDCCGEDCNSDYLTYVGDFRYCEGCMEDGEVMNSDSYCWE